MPTARPISACVVMLCLVTGCKVQDDSSNPKVINGKDATGELPAVVTYYMQTSQGEGDCTGTFLSDTVLITAAHCVADVASADAIFLPDTKIKAVDFRKNANFNMATFIPSMPYDMALVKFPAGTAPATIQLAATPPKIGDQVTIVGFGQTDLAEGGQGAGTKRSGTNDIERLEAGLIMYTGGFESANTSGTDAASSYGDSGGPLLIGGRLAGTCSGEFDRSATGFTDTYVNVFSSAYQQFLNEAVQAGYDIPGVDGVLASTPSKDSGTEVNEAVIAELEKTRQGDTGSADIGGPDGIGGPGGTGGPDGTGVPDAPPPGFDPGKTPGGAPVLFCWQPDGTEKPCTPADLEYERTNDHEPGGPQCRDPHYHYGNEHAP